MNNWPNSIMKFTVASLAILAFVLPSASAATKTANAFMAPEVVMIPAGGFITGSDPAERELGYRLDERAYGHSATRTGKWYDFEDKRHEINLPAFRITKNLITNELYARFVAETGHRAPGVDAKTWASYRLNPPYSRTRRFSWKDRKPPKGRERHPVVLVSLKDAEAFALWLSQKTGKKWQLPSEKQWEKAARGTKGFYFPWGNTFDPAKLNSADKGPFDTTNVGRYPEGASPYGMLDAAGQVFEWTSTPTTPQRHLVKGGSWDDKGCGVCRSAARHARPVNLKHIIIGFRLVLTSTP